MRGPAPGGPMLRLLGTRLESLSALALRRFTPSVSVDGSSSSTGSRRFSRFRIALYRLLLNAALVSVTVGAWVVTYRFGITVGALFCWVPLFGFALLGRWGLGWGTVVGATTAMLAAPYLCSVADSTAGYCAAFGACLLFGIQLGIVAEVYSLLSRWPAVLLCVGPLVVVSLEHGRAWVFAWPTLASHSPLSALPMGQLLSILGPLGLAWLNVFQQTALSLWLTRRASRRAYIAAWVSLLVASNLLGLAWQHSGSRSAPAVSGVLLVQPGVPAVPIAGVPALGRDETAAALTLAALQEHRPNIVVWPETTLGTAYVKETSDGSLRLLEMPGNLDLENTVLPIARRWDTYFIIGLLLHYPNGRRTNGAVCVGPDGSFQWYEKRTLVWFLETAPAELLELGRLLGLWHTPPPVLMPGSPRPAMICSIDGRKMRFRVAICLEKYVYWGAHATPGSNIAAVIHIGDESRFAASPGLLVEHRWALRSRGIQARRWQLSAQAYRGSAVVDPSGQIVAQLPAGPGWIYVGRDGVSTVQLSYAELRELRPLARAEDRTANGE